MLSCLPSLAARRAWCARASPGSARPRTRARSSPATVRLTPATRDRAVLDHVALERRRAARPAAAARSRPRAARATSPTPSTWPWTMWPPSGSPARSGGLEVDAALGGELAERGQRERLVHHVGLEAVRRRPRSRSGRRPRPRPSRPARSSPASSAPIRSRAARVGSLDSAHRPELLDDPGEHQNSCGRLRRPTRFGKPLITTPAAARGRAGPRPSAPTRGPAAARRRRSRRARRRRAAAGRRRARAAR